MTWANIGLSLSSSETARISRHRLRLHCYVFIVRAMHSMADEIVKPLYLCKRVLYFNHVNTL
jgi:hypothetical protein